MSKTTKSPTSFPGLALGQRLPELPRNVATVPPESEALPMDDTKQSRRRAWQINHKEQPFPSVSSYPDEDALIADVKTALGQGTKKVGKTPRIIVIGALGRCGKGAVDLCAKVGVPKENILNWDMAETGNHTTTSPKLPKVE